MHHSSPPAESQGGGREPPTPIGAPVRLKWGRRTDGPVLPDAFVHRRLKCSGVNYLFVSMLRNLHSVASSGQPLCVACNACGHRGTVTPGRLGAFSGNMKQVIHLRLVCPQCQQQDFGCFVMPGAEFVDRFVAGEDLEAFERLRA